jgi:Sec-independent protein translocase protein TatA
MIGLPEILILIFIILLVFRAYRYLPQLGRSSGKAIKTGSDKAKELADKTSEKHGDKLDPQKMGQSAGKGFREAREFRDSFKGALEPGEAAAKPAPAPAKPASTSGEESSGDGNATHGT